MARSKQTKVNMDSAEVTRRYNHLVEVQTGKVAPGYREDGFVNLMNSYGTQRDTTEMYDYEPDALASDAEITSFYEGNGLFSKIIDAPAEEAIKHGFELKDVSDDEITAFYSEALEELDWEETAMQCIKWTRLYGGCIAVMLINDGHGVDEPLDWKNIKSIDDIRVYDRTEIVPDTTNMNKYENKDPFRTRASRTGYPEYYDVNSRSGHFRVHESRCLVFRNGVLPNNSSTETYQLWGVPEYVRINRAVRDAEVAHGYAPKMLDRSVQAIYKMQNLAAELATQGGEERVLKRLQTIDLSRGLLNSIVLDANGEEYDFRTFSYTGVSDVINTTCNFLSAVTNIPQTILFGRSPAGMNATGGSDLENYYNYVERIQKRMVKANLRYLLAVVLQAGVKTGEIEKVPPIKIEFKSLWSMTESEQLDLDLKKAQIESTKAQTANVYVTMQAIDPSEIRKNLAKSDDFDVETMLDDLSEKELEEFMPKQQEGEDPMAAMMGMMGGGGGQQPPQQGKQGNSPDAAPEATKLPQDMKDEPDNTDEDDTETGRTRGVGVLVVKDGKILTGTRCRGAETGTICGPGGHVENGEDSLTAGIRETEEEFGITPKGLTLIGKVPSMKENLPSDVYLCIDFEGEPDCASDEMAEPVWRDLNELSAFEDKLFTPFRESVEILKESARTGYFSHRSSWGA